MKKTANSWVWVGVALLGVCAFSAGLWLRPMLPGGDKAQSGPQVAAGVVRGQPGPWGELGYTPISIAAPDEVLPLQAMEAKPLVWFWGSTTTAELSTFFASVGLSAAQSEQLLQPACVTVRPQGLELRPARDTVVALEPAARQELYKRLARYPENRDDFIYIPSVKLPELLRRSGVSPATADLARKWSCTYGRYTVYFGLACLLSSLPTYEDKVHFLKAVSRQATYLLHLHITPESDINALTRYWGNACWSSDTQAFLESLAAVRGGAWLDVIELLPPLPTSLLYTYPLSQNPLRGPVLIRDCHWTAFNFFRDLPDERYANPSFVFRHLQDDFTPVHGDTRYGDLVLLTKPDGSIIHSAVFLADGFVFSKNGDTDLHPWLICTLADLLDQYAFQVPPEQQLNVVFFRNKYY